MAVSTRLVLEEEMMMLDGGGVCSRSASTRAKPRPEVPPVIRMLVLASLAVYLDWSLVDILDGAFALEQAGRRCYWKCRSAAVSIALRLILDEEEVSDSLIYNCGTLAFAIEYTVEF